MPRSQEEREAIKALLRIGKIKPKRRPAAATDSIPTEGGVAALLLALLLGAHRRRRVRASENGSVAAC